MCSSTTLCLALGLLVLASGTSAACTTCESCKRLRNFWIPPERDTRYKSCLSTCKGSCDPTSGIDFNTGSTGGQMYDIVGECATTGRAAGASVAGPACSTAQSKCTATAPKPALMATTSGSTNTVPASQCANIFYGKCQNAAKTQYYCPNPRGSTCTTTTLNSYYASEVDSRCLEKTKAYAASLGK